MVWRLETVCEQPHAGAPEGTVSSLLQAIRIDNEGTAWWIAEFLSRASAGAAGQASDAVLREVLRTLEGIFALAANQASAEESEAIARTWKKVKTRTAAQDGH